MSTARILHIKGADIRIIEFQIAALFELQAEEFSGHKESRFNHARERKVRPEFLLIDRIIAGAQFFCVMAPISFAEGTVLSVLRSECGQSFGFAFGRLAPDGPDFVEEGAHCFRRFRHCVIELVMGVGLIAEQFGALVAQRQSLCNDRTIVALAALFATRKKCIKQLFAQIGTRG